MLAWQWLYKVGYLHEYICFWFHRERGPNFSKLLYALLCFNKVNISKGKVFLHAEPQVNALSLCFSPSTFCLLTWLTDSYCTYAAFPEFSDTGASVLLWPVEIPHTPKANCRLSSRLQDRCSLLITQCHPCPHTEETAGSGNPSKTQGKQVKPSAIAVLWSSVKSRLSIKM